MKKFNKASLIYGSVGLLLFLLTIPTNFNLIGYNYSFDEESEVFTIQEGYFNKEYTPVHITNDNASTLSLIILSVAKADNIWIMNIFILSMFAAALFLLFNKSFKHSTKFSKKYILLYLVLFISFIIWDIDVNLDSYQEVKHYVNELKR
ncbi:hypothetical protein [Thalassobacillus hwangdonensis]|uniref:DUF4306 domain-containing protein n=1 Tax=Thalassobacillus hwangdonensis TaxID=546108 RepID=A0ABW3L8I8_9BACI